MKLQATKKSAQRLLHEGGIALAEVESNGMAVDVPYIRKAMRKMERKAARLMEEAKATKTARRWKKHYGDKTNFTSPTQLSTILFDVIGHEAPKRTKGGGKSTDEEVLLAIDDPFIKPYLEAKKYQKAAGTNLKGILKEEVDGFIHCFFNLHTTKTFRSSSDSFNFQNIPVRDPKIGKIIRKAFIARKGRRVVEIDIQGAEVRIAACYHQDPRMIQYIEDPSKDMHRDEGMELYCLPQDHITKAIRHDAKNKFVFAQFYGSWYGACAKSLWDGAKKQETTEGVPLMKHLKSKGIKALGNPETGEGGRHTFVEHVKRVEERFWNERFPDYKKWREDWYEAYLERGFIEMLTGFRCYGPMTRNETINYPVQGAAFHCLLWALIRIVREELPKRKMKSKVVGQVHDSMVCDVVDEELDDFLGLCREVLCDLIRKEWDWIIVPLEIEAEVAPVGGSWADKEEYPIPH